MKMIKNILLMVLILPFLALISCSEENSIGSEENVVAKFTSSIANMEDSPQTKASGTTWDNDDAIGIYMTEAGEVLSSATVKAKNMKYITDGTGIFTPESTSDIITFPTDGSNVDFIAYYPYKKETIVDFQYPVDITNQTSQANIDFLYSNNAAGRNNGSSTVTLNFKHKLVKVIFNISSDDINDLSNLGVTIRGSKSKAMIALADGGLVADNNSITNIEALVSPNGKTSEAIILPATSTNGYAFAFSLPSGDTFTWDVSTAEFKEGMKYTYNVKLESTGIVQVDANATIEDWTEGPTENITVGKDAVATPVVNNCPTTAETGATITISGTDLDLVKYAVFNSEQIALTSQTATQITLVIPSSITTATTADLILIYNTSDQMVAASNFAVTIPSAETKILYYENLILEANDPTMSKQFFNPADGSLYSACDYMNSATLKNDIYTYISWFTGGSTIQFNNPSNSKTTIAQFECEGVKLEEEFLPNSVKFRVLKTTTSAENSFIEQVKNKTLTEITPQIVANTGVGTAATSTPRYNSAFFDGDVLMFQKFGADGTTVEKVGFIEIVSVTLNEKASTMTVNCYFQK